MADGVAGPVADSILGLLLNAAVFAGYPALFAQLHLGEPGADGTANPALNTTRAAAGSFARSSAGAWANATAIVWTNVPAGETYSHVSLWSATSAGTFVASGAVTSPAVTPGEGFQVAAGALIVSMPVAA